MRHGAAGRRHRNRGGSNNGSNGGNNNGGRRHNNQRTQVYDSNGPDVRIRGTAHQVADKYMNLAKDAASAGDRVLAESYLQYAEHYIRIIGTWDEDVRVSGENFNEDTRFSRPSEPQAQPQVDSVYKPVEARRDNEDLSLPASILGAPFQVENKASMPSSGPVRADHLMTSDV